MATSSHLRQFRIPYHGTTKIQNVRFSTQACPCPNHPDQLALSYPHRYAIVSQPEPGTVRVRVALTDLDKTALVAKLVPIAKAMGSGRGGVSMEGELVDSQTGE